MIYPYGTSDSILGDQIIVMSLVIDYNTTCSVKFCADLYIAYIIWNMYSLHDIGTMVRESVDRLSDAHHLNIRCRSGSRLHLVLAHLLARNNTHRQTPTHIHTIK